MGKYKQLAKSERLEISILKARGYFQKDIAKALKFSPSTVSRELQRNSNKENIYDAEKANNKAIKRRLYAKTQVRVIISEVKLREFIEEKLKIYKWSPEQISARWKQENPNSKSVSAVIIYKYLESVSGQQYKKYLYLAMKGKRKKKNKAGKKQLIPNRINIEKRPEYINKREFIGDAEGDLIVSKKGEKSALLTVIDRKSRFLFAESIPNKSPVSVVKKMKVITEYYDMNSITLDNGIEFQQHEKYGCDTYFCNPYSSWEKGQIEYANRLIRRFIPKKSVISDFSDKQIQSIIRLINNTPRKCLGYKTPIEVRFSKSINYTSLNPYVLDG